MPVLPTVAAVSPPPPVVPSPGASPSRGSVTRRAAAKWSAAAARPGEGGGAGRRGWEGEAVAAAESAEEAAEQQAEGAEEAVEQQEEGEANAFLPKLLSTEGNAVDRRCSIRCPHQFQILARDPPPHMPSSMESPSGSTSAPSVCTPPRKSSKNRTTCGFSSLPPFRFCGLRGHSIRASLPARIKRVAVKKA
ncbi:uncharacterized protein LOC133895919 [Phragmites australis]|uniref:uncharacterized protein LOC133895919 n=1 Tax=Phragmites australis TaxID=29695 RepID=UPI002D781DD1|nr:uncharacterized protein LOC133895919 [Phragmites australis]